MIDNIIGFVFIGLFALLFLRIGKSSKTREDKDYSQYPIIEAIVQGTEDNHWIVSFEDENGEMVLGRDDKYTRNSFNPPKIRVRKGAREMVYYWPWDRPNHRYRMNDMELKYHIHFCNPAYESYSGKTSSFSFMKCIGIMLLVLAIVVLIFA